MKCRPALITLLIVNLLQIAISCNAGHPTDSMTNKAGEPSPEPKQTSIPAPPEIRMVEQTDLWRTEDQSTTWRDARVGFSTKEEIKKGELVTVLPLDVTIAPINVIVASAKRSGNPCDEELPDVWEVELEPITQAQFLEAPPLAERREETPFEVCVIYPHVPFARQLRSEALSEASFPAEVTRATLTAAIDLSNDLQPEVLIFRFCCDNREKPQNSNCDYICGASYIRKDGLWRLIEELKPC